MVATMTATSGTRPELRHLMLKNFSMPGDGGEGAEGEGGREEGREDNAVKEVGWRRKCVREGGRERG